MIIINIFISQKIINQNIIAYKTVENMFGILAIIITIVLKNSLVKMLNNIHLHNIIQIINIVFIVVNNMFGLNKKKTNIVAIIIIVLIMNNNIYYMINKLLIINV